MLYCPSRSPLSVSSRLPGSAARSVRLWAASSRPDLVRRVVAIATSSVVGRAAAGWYRERIAMIDAGDLEDAGGGYRNAATAMAGMHENPLQPLLGQVRCPVLVVAGELDEFCPPRAARIMLDALPGGRYIEIPKVGHLVLAEAPDALADAVASFLTEVRAG